MSETLSFTKSISPPPRSSRSAGQERSSEYSSTRPKPRRSPAAPAHGHTHVVPLVAELRGVVSGEAEKFTTLFGVSMQPRVSARR
jgi:hypothetical protein